MKNLQKSFLKGKRIIVAVVLIFVISLFFILYFSVKKQMKNNPVTLVANINTYIQEKDNLPVDSSYFGLPVRLKIPSLNINAIVDSVGLASDGTVDVPPGPSDVAWFNLGPHPGENGSSVIDGHSGWKDGIPAVFDNLYELHIGDKLSVQDNKGKIINFIVRELKTYSPYENAPSVFNSNDGKAHLNLITCTGTWDETQKSHSERLVVFADKEIK